MKKPWASRARMCQCQCQCRTCEWCVPVCVCVRGVWTGEAKSELSGLAVQETCRNPQQPHAGHKTTTTTPGRARATHQPACRREQQVAGRGGQPVRPVLCYNKGKAGCARGGQSTTDDR